MSSNTPVKFFRPNSGKYALFSNFSESTIVIDGLSYPTVEHYFQSQKFSDLQYREKIRNAPTPNVAKILGNSKKLPIRSDWDTYRNKVMMVALTAKRDQNAEFRRLLLSTGSRLLIENSPYDYYWGCGRNGTGNNMLGTMLMRIRASMVVEAKKNKD